MPAPEDPAGKSPLPSQSGNERDIQPLLKAERGREKINVLGVEVVNDDDLGDYVWIFPLKTSEEALLRQQAKPQTKADLPKCDRVAYGWDDVYKAKDCLNMAKEIFVAQRPKANEHELPTSRDRLTVDFQKDMTRLEFHTKIMERAMDLLTGNRIGLTVNTTLSADNDELFYCIGTDRRSELIKLIANSEGYRAALRASAYPVGTARDSVGEDGKMLVPHVNDGQGPVPVPGWTTYELENDAYYEDFREIDKLRMMRRRIGHFIDTNAMERFGVMIKKFVAHKYKDVAMLEDPVTNFGHRWSFWRFPSHRIDEAKDYFGEEMAFFFHWFRFYTVQLVVPTLVALILFARRFFGLDMETQRMIQDCFCLFMALWAAQFCENYNRQAIIQATVWGTRNYDNVASIRSGYRDHDDADRKATWWSALGASVMSTFLACIIGGIAVIQSVRYVMVHHPSDNPITAFIIKMTDDREFAIKMGAKLGAVLITMQVKALDMAWGKIAVVVTERENHKTESRYQSSLVFKVVMVKFFNAMYPFLYVAFAKEYVEGCSGPGGSCILALETCLTTFFLVHMAVTGAMLIKRIVMTRLLVHQEVRKPGVDGANYTYLQVQAKLDDFVSSDMLNDYMELTVQFAMVTCFSVVLPILTMLALASNMIEYRIIAYRQLHVVQRVYPSGAESIGAWQSIFAAIATMAMIVNAGLGVFAMKPFRDWETEHKLLAFLVGEHILIFSKVLVEVAIPDLPAQVDKAEDKQEAAIIKMFGGFFKPVHIASDKLPMKTPVMCNPDGNKSLTAKYTLFHQTPAGKHAKGK
ncbi:unnamed protein product [Amoebophrya sp. A120]|nr:unnamed protein product [Amoebophrya sp. A120]|eukprot:GSA120T00010776001.1